MKDRIKRILIIIGFILFQILLLSYLVAKLYLKYVLLIGG